MRIEKGDLSKEMKIVNLSELVKPTKFAIVDGPFGTQLHSNEYTTQGIPVIRIKNITRNNSFDSSDLVYITKEKFQSLKRSAVYPNDILLAKTGATIGKVCLFPQEIKEGLIASSCAKISIDEKKANPKYVMLFLSTNNGQNQILALSGGSTRNSINLKPVGKIKIPLPPLEKQKKIVSILEKAEELKRFRVQADKLTNKLLQSVFLEMFGDPERNEKNYDCVKLSKLSFRITKGESPKWQGFDYEEKGIAFITSENVQWGNLDTKNLKYIPIEFHKKLRRSSLEANNLLVNLVGASIGRVCLANKEVLPANINQAVAVISLNEEKLVPDFALYYLLSRACQKALRSNIVEAARANISLTNLNELDIVLPPIELQKKFSQIVKKVEALQQTQNHSIQEINNLFNTLMQKAFKGELTV